jgi:predicted RNase H-like HicB family nuclease
METRVLTAIVEREGHGFVALCPELDIASQDDNREQAERNLREAVDLFLETADASEVSRRLSSEVYVSRLEDAVERGRLPGLVFVHSKYA